MYSLTVWFDELYFLGEVAALVSVLIVGCVTVSHPGEPGLREHEGTASYYADKFVGRSTANGEVYDPDATTAAHRTLPFGTRVRVTRTDHPGAPSVVVRINDRGPFKHGRIIDLSEAAAARLEMIGEGVVPVRLQVISYPEDVDRPSEASNIAW